MAQDHNRRVAIIQMLVCATLWSIGGIFIKLIPWNPFAIAGFRSLIAAVSVLVFLFVKRQKIVVSRNVLTSMFFLSATFLCFVSANKLTTAANAIVLQFTAPVFIVVFSALFFRQKYTKWEIATVVAALAGISVFFLESMDRGKLLGNVIAVVSGITMAGMFLAVGKAEEKEKISGILFGHLLTAAVGVPFFFFTGHPVSPMAVTSVVVLGVVQLGIPYILFGLASVHCPPLACSLISAMEPLLNPVWVMLFYDERPGPLALLGGVIVIAAVTVQCVLQDRAARAQIPLP